MQTPQMDQGGFPAPQTRPIAVGEDSSRRLEDLLYQAVTIIAILLALGGVWIF